MVAVDREMRSVLCYRLQQRALITIDHGTAQVNAILHVQRRVPTLAEFGCDDGIGKLALAHFHDGGARRRLKPRPRGKAEDETEAILPA